MYLKNFLVFSVQPFKCKFFCCSRSTAQFNCTLRDIGFLFGQRVRTFNGAALSFASIEG